MAVPQQPYFMRALYEWCVDSGYAPHISVRVDARARVPAAFVKDGQIVLNIGPNAVRNLQIDNDWITFSARFSGVAQNVQVPIDAVLAVYARETGEGMAFQPANLAEAVGQTADDSADDIPDAGDTPPPPPKGRPILKVVK